MYRVEGRLDKMVDAYGYVNGKLIYNIWFIYRRRDETLLNILGNEQR
jgi:hypothetical protein